jgi:hypothetical protein
VEGNIAKQKSDIVLKEVSPLLKTDRPPLELD